MTASKREPRGVLPNEVIKNPASSGFLFFCTLAPEATAEQAQAWLKELTGLVHTLDADDLRGDQRGSAAVALGASFFMTADGPRFGLVAEQTPCGLRTPRPPLPVVVEDPVGATADVVIYVMSPVEAVVAEFERGLAGTRPTLARVAVERGYQRRDRREQFGFLDGLRNTRRNERDNVALIDRAVLPEEPAWAERGSYMAYMKLRQNVEGMASRPQPEREALMGRREADGSRLDLPPGTNPRTEGEITGDPPATNSHVRKAGPRGPLHDRTQILRRGIPYSTLAADGSLDAGLQFVSFQASLDSFDTVLRRWMLNPDFPSPRTGTDALFANALVTVAKEAVFFVPPHDERFIGAGAFDQPKPEPKPHGAGRVAIRKRVTNPAGEPVLAELGGIGFQVFDAASGQPIGDAVETDSQGHASIQDLPLGKPLLVREVALPSGFQPAADVPVTLTRKQEVVFVTNIALQPAPGYGG